MARKKSLKPATPEPHMLGLDPYFSPFEPQYNPNLVRETLAEVEELVRKRGFNSFDEFAEASFFLEMEEAEEAELQPLTELQLAEALAFEASNVSNRRKRTKMAHEALEMSADCAHAYILLAEVEREMEKKIELFEKASDAARRNLVRENGGSDDFELLGHLDTGQYTMILAGLAGGYWQLHRREEAIATAQVALKVNPEDYTGARFSLSAWLLTMGDNAAAEELFVEFDELHVVWAWGETLLAFRKNPAGKEALLQLEAALNTNEYVPLYLLDRTTLPRKPLDFALPGTQDEAAMYAFESKEAWETTPGALEWLEQSMETFGIPVEPLSLKRKR